MKKLIKTELIMNYIKNNNLTKKEFCKQCNISIYILNKILNYKTNIRITAFIKIAELLKIHMYELLEDEKNSH